MKSIAEAVGVSEMTVSRALRSHPEVSDKTRKKIQKVAHEMGYAPDPQIIKMMAYMRQANVSKVIEKLAFLWLDASKADATKNLHSQKILTGAKNRAKQLGFEIEEFFVEADGLSQTRLSTILNTRAINGVIVSPLHHHVEYPLELRWEQFSTVVIGRGQVGPALHRVGPDHYQGMACALRELSQLGYRRIGLCVSGGSLHRQDHLWEGSFLMHHPLGARKAIALMLVEPEMRVTQVERWLQKQQPEVLLFQGQSITAFIDERKQRGNWDLPHASLDWLPQLGKEGIAGLNQHNDISGANAVDLVTAHILRNQRGLPGQPKHVLCEGNWVHGESAPSIKQ